MPAQMVPNENLRFDSCEETYRFYCYYARMAGLSVHITKTHLKVGGFNCNKQGKCEFYKPGEERKIEKTSQKTCCKAFVKAKLNKKKGYWYFDRIRMEHNHVLTPCERGTDRRRDRRRSRGGEGERLCSHPKTILSPRDHPVRVYGRCDG
jgi:hypothetical protein